MIGRHYFWGCNPAWVFGVLRNPRKRHVHYKMRFDWSEMILFWNVKIYKHIIKEYKYTFTKYWYIICTCFKKSNDMNPILHNCSEQAHPTTLGNAKKALRLAAETCVSMVRLNLGGARWDNSHFQLGEVKDVLIYQNSPNISGFWSYLG